MLRDIKMMEQSKMLDDLPSEILLKIGKLLNWFDVLQISRTNRRLYSVMSSNELWKIFYQAFFSSKIEPNEKVESYKKNFLLYYSSGYRQVKNAGDALKYIEK